MRIRVLTAAALLILCLTVPAVRAEDDTATAILKSAGAKGGEIAAKALAGLLYDTSCKNVNLDAATGYICKILGSVSGRAEDEWKAGITNQLKQISAKLDTIETGQREIQRELTTQHQLMETRFKQISSNVVAGTHLVRVEGLWEKFQAQFDKVDGDVTRGAMIDFANEIMKSEPHTILADLNVVLTKPVLDGQPLVRYPFYEWRQKNEVVMNDRLNAAEVYDFAEKKFVDFRLREEKAYVMYLWAATVLETQCALKGQPCTTPPRSTAEFKADYDRYTRQQTEAFNAGVDWLLLGYSSTRMGSAGNFLPSGSTGILLRANFLTSSIVGPGRGLWGRVYGMGKSWDGSLQVTCGGTAQTLMPVLAYSTQVSGNGMFYSGKDNGPLDWWVSSQGNATFDEVRFANDWQVYHYSVPTAATGPCTVSQNLPKGGYLPWVQPATSVVEVPMPDQQSFPFGSFIAIQRAGGNYALLSGSNWQAPTPERVEDGSGQREKVVYESFVEPDHPGGPWVGLLVKGRGEYRVRNGSSRIHNQNKILLRQSKTIRFPEDRTLKFRFFPGQCQGQLCASPGASSILNYDIENNDTESKKGKLDSVVAVSFREAGSNSPDYGTGMVVNGSYGKTGDRKQTNVTGEQTGVVTADPGKRYQLTYLIYFDLETEGRGLDATEYMYRGLLAPGTMFLTK
jgi:hypothetical protein